MAHHDVKCVLAIAPNYWGKGKDMKEAERQLKAAGYSDGRRAMKTGLKRVYYFFSCEPDKVQVRGVIDVDFNWPKDAECMRLEVNW